MRSPPTLDALRQDPALAAALEPGDRLRLLADAEAVAGVLRALVTAPERPSENGHEHTEPSALLTPKAAAERLGLTVKQLYRRKLPFVQRVGDRTLRYDPHGLALWLKAQGRQAHARGSS